MNANAILESARTGPSCLVMALVVLPALTLPAFFLHPGGFTWIVIDHISTFFKNIVGGAHVALDILREGNLTTFVVLLWLVVGAVAIHFVRKMNVPLDKKAHRRKGRVSSDGGSGRKNRRGTKSKHRGKASKNRPSSHSAGTEDLGEADANAASARKKSRKAAAAARRAEANDSDDSSDIENELFEHSKNGGSVAKDAEKARLEEDVKRKLKEEALKQKGRKGKKSFDGGVDEPPATTTATMKQSPLAKEKVRSSQRPGRTEAPPAKEQAPVKNSRTPSDDKNLFLQQKKGNKEAVSVELNPTKDRRKEQHSSKAPAPKQLQSTPKQKPVRTKQPSASSAKHLQQQQRLLQQQQRALSQREQDALQEQQQYIAEVQRQHEQLELQRRQQHELMQRMKMMYPEQMAQYEQQQYIVQQQQILEQQNARIVQEFQNHMMQMQQQQQQQQATLQQERAKQRKPYRKGGNGFQERDAHELCEFLNGLDLMDYARALIDERIDVSTLFELTAKDLEHFFPQVGPRRRLQAGLKRRAKDALKLQSQMVHMKGKGEKMIEKVSQKKAAPKAKFVKGASPPAMSDAENLAFDMASSLFDD